MTRREYEEAYVEHIIRTIEQILTLMLIVLCLIMLAVVTVGNIKISMLEEELGINYNLVDYKERIPIDKMIEDYIDSLPLPVLEEPIVEISQTYTSEDVELLARLMYAEEGIFIYRLPENEAKYVNQLAGSVVLHRKNMNYRGAETIEEVIYDKGQYACVENGSIYQEVPDIVYKWAEELLKEGPLGPENMIYQAEFEQGSEVFDHIGNQYFCMK